MKKPTYHILVCNSYRVRGEPQGVCNRKSGPDLPRLLEEGVLDRGIDAMVSTTSCLKMCEKGPIMVVYPQSWWYAEVDEDKVEQILDAMEAGQPAEGLLMN